MAKLKVCRLKETEQVRELHMCCAQCRLVTLDRPVSQQSHITHLNQNLPPEILHSSQLSTVLLPQSSCHERWRELNSRDGPRARGVYRSLIPSPSQGLAIPTFLSTGKLCSAAALHSLPWNGLCPPSSLYQHTCSPCSSLKGDPNSKFIKWISSCSCLRNCVFRACFWIHISLSYPGCWQPWMYLSNTTKNEKPGAHRQVTLGWQVAVCQLLCNHCLHRCC